MAPERPLSYYGKPIIKETVWKAEIPTYFFFGGLGGMSSSIALAARLTGNDVLARRALLTAATALGISPVLLIKDLGRPARFLNMLRVFKVRSPLSMGTWILSAAGGAAGTAAVLEVTGLFPGLKRFAEGVAGALGPALSTYTGGLLADSVVPVWHEGRRELPLLFGASAAAAAGGAAALLTPVRCSGPARRLAVAGAATELVMQTAMERRVGELVAEPFHSGKAERYTKLAKGLTAGGGALMAVAGRRRGGAVAAGALLLAGSACERFAVYHAGKISARDPKYTTLPQRERAAAHGNRVTSTP